MHRESLRRKIVEAKVNVEKAFAENGTQNPSLRIAVKSLFLVVDNIVVVLLEKKTRKSSSNSGLPPSRNNGSNGNRNKSEF